MASLALPLALAFVVIVDIALAKRYVIMKTRVNFFEAERQCQANHHRLATVYSDTEQQNLKQLIEREAQGEEYLWIGLNCLGNKGEFKWFSTGQPKKYETWCQGQPDNWNNEEDCVAMYVKQDYKWNDCPCSREFFFVCDADFQ